MSDIEEQRKYYERMMDEVGTEYRRRISDLQAENEKLRELVRNVEHYERFGCQGCPHSGSCGSGTLYDEDCAMSREIERGKRELGIEVDA